MGIFSLDLKSVLGFQSKDPSVKWLLAWKKGDQNGKWGKKALELLVKRLGKTADGEENLAKLDAALSSADELSACVPMATHPDGRIQLSYRKVLPHLVFCRLWRWPDLVTHRDLHSVAGCMFPFEPKTKAVCINPYHYRRNQPEELKEDKDKGVDDLAMPGNVTVLSVSVKPVEIGNQQPSYSYPSPPTTPNDSGESLSNDSGLPEASSSSSNLTSSGAFSASSNSQNEPIFVPAENESEEAPEIPPFWCKISYYELSTRVGPIFSVIGNPVTIDGFTNPQIEGNDRISLGSLFNVHRNSTIVRTRLHIGDGIRLHYIEGQLFVEVLFEHAIFVQSELLNLLNGNAPTTVTKITRGTPVKIFDDGQFAEVLEGHFASGSDYRTMYKLNRMCHLRLSFIKGWGGEPYFRAEVTMTPCWLEIQMRHSMMRLDQQLVRMVGPEDGSDSQ